MNIDVNEIKLKIHLAFANKGIFPDDDDMLISDLIIDSFAFITLIIEIESVLDIEFPDELLVINSLGTINTLSAYLFEHLNNSISGDIKQSIEDDIKQSIEDDIKQSIEGDIKKSISG